MSNHQVIAWVEPVHSIGLLKRDMALEGDSGVKLGLQQYGHWMIHQSCHDASFRHFGEVIVIDPKWMT